MGFIAVKCPNCGAEVNLDESREFGFCTYCGTKVVQEKIVVEHRGQVSVDGISTKENVLERADNYIAQGDFERATIYYNKALDLDPKSAIVYWKLLLCRLKLKSDEQMLQLYANPSSAYSIDLKNYSEYENALRYANDEELERFLSINRQIESRNAKVRAAGKLKKEQWTIVGLFLMIFVLFVVVGIIITVVSENEAAGVVFYFLGIVVAGVVVGLRVKKKVNNLTPAQREQNYQAYIESKAFQKLSPKQQEKFKESHEKNQSKQ